jgi:peroxiredoxin
MPRPRVDLVAPAFELPASTGQTVASWDFKSRTPLILFFAHSECEACRDYLCKLKQDAVGYNQHQAQVLVLLPAPLGDCKSLADNLDLPFPVLADAHCGVRSRYIDAANDVAVFVLDRYGEPYGSWVARDADALPGAEPILSTLELTELECPECGVPDWF